MFHEKEISPADVLILDTSEFLNKEAICFTNRENLSGESEKTLKKACVLTQNGNCPSPKASNNKGFSSLSFKLDFFRNQEDSLNGYLRLFNDPKTEKVTYENFIEKGEKISTRWVFAVVVLVGKDVRIMRDFKRKLYRKSRLEKNCDMFFYAYLIITVVLALFGEIMFISRSIYNYNESDSNINMNHLLLYVTVFPLDLHYLSEIWFLFLKFKLQRKFKDINLIQQPNLLTNLAHLDYILLEKTHILTRKSLEISLIYFKSTNSVYNFDALAKFQLKFNKFRSKTHSLLVPAGPASGYPGVPYQAFLENENDESKISHSPELRKSKHFFRDFISFPYNYTETIIGLLSCGSQASFPGKIWKIWRKEEKTIRKMCEVLGFRLMPSNLKGEFKIFFNNNEEIQRKTLAFHEELGVFSSIIIQDAQKDGASLYAKGKLKDFLTRLNEESRKSIDSSLLEKFYRKGCLNPRVFTRKKLDSHELASFLEKYKNLHSSLINQQEYLSVLFSDLLQGLDLISLLGFEETLAPDSMDFIRYVKDLNINLWLLSGDSCEKVYSVAHRLQVFDMKADRFYIDAGTIEDLSKQIKNILNSLSKEIKPLKENCEIFPKRKASPPMKMTRNKELMTFIEEKKEKFLLIDGKILRILLNNEYLFSHFCFIAQIVKTIIGYNFADIEKRDFLKIIKEKFSQNTTVLTIGNGWKDRLMVDYSDISIETMDNAMKIADVSVKGVGTIVDLIRGSGDLYEKYLNFIEFSYYKSLIFTVGLFVFIFFDEFYANCLYDPLITLFFFTIFSLFTQGVLLGFYEKIRENFRKDFKELYHEARFRGKAKELFKRLLFLIMEASIIAGLISLDTFYNGLDYNSLGLTLSLSIMMFLVIKVFFFFYKVFLQSIKIVL